jgi:hypothetical protein
MVEFLGECTRYIVRFFYLIDFSVLLGPLSEYTKNCKISFNNGRDVNSPPFGGIPVFFGKLGL